MLLSVPVAVACVPIVKSRLTHKPDLHEVKRMSPIEKIVWTLPPTFSNVFEIQYRYGLAIDLERY